MNDLQTVREKASYHLEQIQKLFLPTSKATLLVRCTEHEDADFILTNDEGDNVLSALHRLFNREQA